MSRTPSKRAAGPRIRARRRDLGIRQADLARTLGISASYLNLIEHDHRQVGGKLLSAIAAALDTDSGQLAEGAEGAQLDGLRAAAAQRPPGHQGDPLEDPEAIAARFPGWARLVTDQAARIAGLERALTEMNDRMTHDPFLSESLHDVLSSVTAIRSSSGILMGDGAMDAEWQARFHRNIHEDSQRLTESAQSLVAYLDGAAHPERTPMSPQEEVDAWLAERDFTFPAEGPDPDMAPPDTVGGAARALIADLLDTLRADAAALPADRVADAIARHGTDIPALAGEMGGDLHRLFRRLTLFPGGIGGSRAGLVICDATGVQTFRRPVSGFDLPRFGAGCALWPLYGALAAPAIPLYRQLETVGRTPRRFDAYAVALPHGVATFDTPPVFRSAMLILPARAQAQATLRVGAGCRICPHPDCTVRREPAIVALTG
ncbi:helix-turn-helix domain-containing protein [Oceaniglobus indicus]|uniref:helix-turn-helix domain-containing protein n=1 Tax=Oceaniglobus indicus TaxID=2047749 RepID=UPI000C1801B0|nr:helix-turn-helix domain-containing protein [Oceaniglobus indicus]